VSKPLSIVHVIRSPVGGIFRHVADLTSAQRAAGHSVGLICDSVSGGAFEEQRIAALAPQLRLGVRRVHMSRSISPADLPSTLAVAKCVAAMRPDIVHGHGAKGGVYGRLAGMIERRRRPVASFYAPHGGSLHYEKGSLTGRLSFAVERALERITDGLIHVSAYEAGTYREKIGVPRCPTHVVHNGLRSEEFEPVRPLADAADFLFIGELRHLKGVDVFIEALALLKREGRGARALIVGAGPAQEERAYREQVAAAGLSHLVAFRPPMPAREAFALARIVVLPSRAESLPYLVLEAAAAAVRLIVTHVGGIPEIFVGNVERLLPPGDPRALALAMQASREDLDASAKQALLLQASVKENFSLAQMTTQIEAIYRAALERRYSSTSAGTVREAGLRR
jgi:glycosyltransferase involved in cell wall biosynthesis